MRFNSYTSQDGFKSYYTAHRPGEKRQFNTDLCLLFLMDKSRTATIAMAATSQGCLRIGGGRSMWNGNSST